MFTQIFKRPPTQTERASSGLDVPVFLVRGHKTVLDEHLAGFFGTTVQALHEHIERSRGDFSERAGFQITRKEKLQLRCPCGCLSKLHARTDLPWALTEEGIFKLAEWVGTPQAIGLGMFIAMMLTDSPWPPGPDCN